MQSHSMNFPTGMQKRKEVSGIFSIWNMENKLHLVLPRKRQLGGGKEMSLTYSEAGERVREKN